MEFLVNRALSMLHFPQVHWLSIFGAFSLGIAAGWLSYLLAVTRWNDRPRHIAFGAVAIGILLAITKVIPARYGHRLEVGVVLVVVGAIGFCVGWVLRDLADFMPAATRSGTTASSVTVGSYIYRDAFAGMGAGSVYMRATTGQGGSARLRLPPNHDDLAKAPAPGGYTFPKARPLADAMASRQSEAPTDRRPHWTWPALTQPATVTERTAAAGDLTLADGSSS